MTLHTRLRFGDIGITFKGNDIIIYGRWFYNY